MVHSDPVCSQAPRHVLEIVSKLFSWIKKLLYCEVGCDLTTQPPTKQFESSLEILLSTRDELIPYFINIIPCFYSPVILTSTVASSKRVFLIVET